MRGAMRMALIRNNYGDGATNRRRRDERGRYMEGDDYASARAEYSDYIEYDERPTARQMGFGEAYGRRGGGGEMRGGYVRYSRADMNDNDQRRMNSGGMHGEFAEQGEHKRHYGGGMKRMEDYRQKAQPLTRQKAEEWVQSMKGEGGDGETWSMKEIEEIAKKHNMPMQEHKLVELYATMNMLASDYYKVAEEFDVLEDDFFVCMAKAFLDDEDAVKDKLAMYYECIAKK